MPATHKRTRTKTMITMYPDGRDVLVTVAINMPYLPWYMAAERLDAGEIILALPQHVAMIRSATAQRHTTPHDNRLDSQEGK